MPYIKLKWWSDKMWLWYGKDHSRFDMKTKARFLYLLGEIIWLILETPYIEKPFFQIHLTNTISKNRVRDIPMNGLFFLTLPAMLVKESRSTWSWSTKMNCCSATQPRPSWPMSVQSSGHCRYRRTQSALENFNTKWADFSLITTVITGQHKKTSWTVQDEKYNDILYSWIEEQFCKDFILLKNVSYL